MAKTKTETNPPSHSAREATLAMDWDLLARELLRAVRGGRSQNAVNRRLSSARNLMSRWECGFKRISWPDFVEVCKVCKIDVDSAVKKAILSHLSAEDPAGILRRLVGELEPAVAAGRLGVSRQTLARWLQQESVPDLADILRAIHDFGPAFFQFLELLADVATLPSVASLYQVYREQRSFLQGNPDLAPLLELLGTPALMKPLDDEALARRAGLSSERLQDLLAHLERLGLVERRDGYWIYLRRQLDLHSPDPQDYARFRQYWSHQHLEAVERASQNPTTDAFGFLIFSVTPEARERVLECLADCYREVQKIIADQGNLDERTRIQVLSLGLFEPVAPAKK